MDADTAKKMYLAWLAFLPTGNCTTQDNVDFIDFSKPHCVTLVCENGLFQKPINPLRIKAVFFFFFWKPHGVDPSLGKRKRDLVLHSCFSFLSFHISLLFAHTGHYREKLL